MYKNKNNGKIAKITKTYDGYVWFIIDGLEACLSECVFYLHYEKTND